MITPKGVAEKLNGSEYPLRIHSNLKAEAKAAGIVIVYGASDDLMEFDGAINDEIGCYDGGTAYLDSAGLLQNDCDNDDCPHFKRAKNEAATIEAVWGNDGISWVYETTIPHETFLVMEDGETYCRGIVFALSDVPS